MDIQNLIIVIVSFILAFFAIKFITKILFKLLILILILLSGLLFYQYFSDVNIIDDVNALYCKDNTEFNIKCNCFVNPILSDLSERFSSEQLDSIKSRKIKSNTEFLKSYTNKEEEIKNCFKKYNQSNSIIEEIFKDLKKMKLPF